MLGTSLATYEYTIVFRPTAAHSNADTLSSLPLTIASSEVPVVPETVLLLEKKLMMDHLLPSKLNIIPLKIHAFLDFVQHGWPNFVKEDNLKPYWNHRIVNIPKWLHSMGK